MGYTYSIKFKTEQEVEKMKMFYEKNIDIIQELSNAEGYGTQNVYSPLKIGKELSYSPRLKNLLGFDVGSGYPYYIILISAWMASKADQNNIFFYYDSEKIDITNPQNSLQVCVNEKGIQTQEYFLRNKDYFKFTLFMIEGEEAFKHYINTVETLFEKLNKRWEAFNHQPKTVKLK